MGIYAIATVENSRDISLDEFLSEMKKDEWGKLYCQDFSDPKYPPWGEFEWEGKRYFTARDTPKYWRLIEQECDFEPDDADPDGLDSGRYYYYDNPDFDYKLQVSFLKAMAAAERLAGGPVYFADDAVLSHEPPPPEDPDPDEHFGIPYKLDGVITNWREIANTNVSVEELVSCPHKGEIKNWRKIAYTNASVVKLRNESREGHSPE